MAIARSKNESMRAQLVDACRALREFLKMDFEPQMRWPDGVALYQERWQRLDAVLEEFQRVPTNFDSRTGVGLAELIHRVEPTAMLEGTGRTFFTLRPDGHAERSFGPHDLAKTLEEAYKRKGFGDKPIAGFDEVWGEDYDQNEPDLICSELNNFFNGLSKILLRREDDQALASLRKDSQSREHYEDEAVSRAQDRDSRIQELFARKCCEFCFRLIPERSGETKSTIGKTCALHDPKKNPSLYRSARAKHIAQKKNLTQQRKNKKIDIAGNAVNPELATWKLHNEMTTALLNLQAFQILDNDLFSKTMNMFSADKNTPVDTTLLNDLLDQVQHEFPAIARPDQFAARIQSLIEKSKHTPSQLIGEFGWFVFDEYLPFHPVIVAAYMHLFLEETWFAQNHEPDYYGSDRGKGRPRKIDHTGGG